MWSAAIYLTNFLLLIHFTTQVHSIYNFCEAERKEPWSYKGQNGPSHWGKKYEDCNGRNQSPINIIRRLAQEEKLAPLNFTNYDVPITTGIIVNNGHTAQFTPGDPIQRSVIIDDSASPYTFIQLHFHWGTDNKGSEHKINFRQYTMELHFVHQNDMGELAVLAVLFQNRLKGNDELQKVVDKLSDIPYKGDQAEVNSSLNLQNLLPDTSEFYRYNGSLTTPTCAEGVKWTVFPDVLPVSRSQMKEFRNLYTVKKEEDESGILGIFSPCKMDRNYRPIQDLNGRTVYYSN